MNTQFCLCTDKLLVQRNFQNPMYHLLYRLLEVSTIRYIHEHFCRRMSIFVSQCSDKDSKHFLAKRSLYMAQIYFDGYLHPSNPSLFAWL